MRLLRESDSLDKNNLTQFYATHESPRLQPIYTLHSGNNKKNRAGLFVSPKRFVFYRFTLQVNLGDKSGVNQYLKIPFISVFIHVVWGKQCYACVPVFYHTDLEKNLFFLALFKPIILHFFTILRDKLRSFPWISRTIEARASFEQKIIELTTL